MIPIMKYKMDKKWHKSNKEGGKITFEWGYDPTSEKLLFFKSEKTSLCTCVSSLIPNE